MATMTEVTQNRLEDAMLVVCMTWTTPGLIDEEAAWASLHKAIDAAMTHGGVEGALATVRGAAERADSPLSPAMRDAALRACEYVAACVDDAGE